MDVWDLLGICCDLFFAETSIFHKNVRIFWPKSPGEPSDDLGRSFGIISTPKFQHPTMLVNHFHFCFVKTNSKKNMKVELFGHSLNPRSLGTPLCPRAPNSIQDSLNESSVRPNGTPVMHVLRSRSTVKKTVRKKTWSGG